MKEYEILVHYGFVTEDGEIDSEQEEYISVFAENEDDAYDKCANSFPTEVEIFSMIIEDKD